jgi:hypothetical protein
VTPVDTFFPALIEVNRSITNNSGVEQNFVTGNSSTGNVPGRIYFVAPASAGENVVITNQGSASNAPKNHWGGFTQFLNMSNAGKATFISNIF